MIAYLLEGGRRENVITVSWAIAGIRISRTGETSTTSVLIGGHDVYSRKDVDELPWETEAPASGPHISRGEIARYLLPAVMPLGRLCVAVFRQIRIEEICGRVRIGTGDPVSTGMLYGGYWASRFAMNASRIFVEMEPVFGARVVDCDLTLRLKLRHPLVIIIEAFILLRNSSVRKLMAAFRTSSNVSVTP
jgi:hypothetical protein